MEFWSFGSGRDILPYMTHTISTITEKAIPVFRREGVLRASLFGSYSRGDATEASDVDFLIEIPKSMSLLDVVGLKQGLEEVLGKMVDVVTPRALHSRLKDSILAEATIIYER